MDELSTVQQSPRPALFGRVAERAALDRTVDSARTGHSACLVLEGPPGIGKTRLLLYAADAAADLTVLRATGLELERQLAFAGLHQLLVPLMARVPGLPAPQRAALRSVFGHTSGPPPDHFLVGLAVLTLVSDAAADTPLVLLVDDAHWIDDDSMRVMSFVARRLAADPVAVVFSTRPRPDPDPLTGFAAVALSGLDAQASDLLVRTVAATAPASTVVARVVAETGGNPLAMSTLVRQLDHDQLTAGASLPDALPLPYRLERHFLTATSQLPADTRTLLLIAAADTTGDRGLLARACNAFGIDLGAADAATTADLFTVEPVPAFRHPLVRSAVYGAAAPGDRRRVHHVLASVTDARVDPDRRAWHRAGAVVGADEKVAAQLEHSADRAGARAGYATQAGFLARAADLSPTGYDRSRRLLAAAQVHLIADQLDAAQHRLEQALPELRETDLTVQARRVQAGIAFASTRPAEAPRVLLDAIGECRDTDPGLAWDMVYEAFAATQMAGEYTHGTDRQAVSEAALALPPRKGPATTADLLVTALATRCVVGHAAAVPLLRHAVDTLLHDPSPSDGSIPLVILGASAADELWDDVRHRALVEHLNAHNRARGALTGLRVGLGVLAMSEVWAGNFAAAAVLSAEVDELSRARGVDEGPASRLALMSLRGPRAELHAVATGLLELTAHKADLGVLGRVSWLALVVAHNAERDHVAAMTPARRLFDADPLGLSSQALPEIVEAAVNTGNPLAASALARLEQRATASGLPWAMGLLARSQALAAAPNDAEALYRRAIDLLAATTVRTDLARAHLVYGEWLRRQARPRDARDHLENAHSAFASMGAVTFAARARLELEASGGSVRDPATTPPDLLTPQETQVAARAASGFTNKETAAQLFITASTVEYHLTRVFRKLGITSRRQLRARLAENAGPHEPRPR